MGRWALSVACASAVSVGYLAWHVVKSGLFHKLEVKAGTLPSYKVAFKCHTGEYWRCGQHCDEIVKASGLRRFFPDLGLLMIWLDDPAKVPPAQTRFVVGLIILPGTEAAGERLKGRGYAVTELPSVQCGVARFPFTGILSIMLAIRNVYKRLADFASNEGVEDHGPFMEATWANRQYSDYYVPLESQEAFLLGNAPTAEYAKTLAEVPA